jgi:hypothetical protein
MGASKVAAEAYLTALRNAKHERLSVRTLLNTCVSPLRDVSNLHDAQRAQSLLEQTSAAPNDTTLIDHMKRLYAMLIEPVLLPVIVNRGRSSMIVRVQNASESLLAAVRQRAVNSDVSAASDERDILDGILVTLTRSAAAAAGVAARRLGQPALAAEFKLVYFRRSSSTPVVDGDEPAAP